MFTYTVGKKSQIDSVFTYGYSRQFAGDAEGVDYGIGVYCNISYNDKETPRESLARYNRDPRGNCIFRNELKGGLNRFLIFDERFAKQVYGEHYLIKDQVYTLFPKEVADDLWKDIVRYMKMDTSSSGNGNHMKGRTAGLLQYMMSKHLRGNVANPKKYESIFGEYNVRGAIYRGMSDGFCMVVYNYDEIKPVAYSIDGGRTYIKKNVKYTYPDVVRKLKRQYKKVDYPIAIECEGEIFYFAKVLKQNNKYNYIDATTNKEISPVDFDSCTSINPENGEFQVEYNGKFYEACPDGFFDGEGEGHTWDELPFFDDDIDNLNEDNKRYSKILKEAFINTLSEVNMFSEILNEARTENNLEEFNYNGENVHSLSYFDNPSIPSIYHVTRKDVVNSVFKFGFDREFIRVCAYGKGIYAAIDIPNARHQLGSYGDSMIQLKLIGGYKNFLVFQEDIARKLYGEHHSILSQLKTFLPHDEAHEVYSQCGNDIRSYSKVAGKYGIRGAIYNWGGVIVVLPFDFSLAVPYAVSYDGGKTFQKKLNQETFERFQSSIDVEWRYGSKYLKIEKAIPGPNENGELTGFAKVQKKNRKYSIIDIQTGKEVIPEVDSCTTMNPENGEFQIEYNDKFYNACLDGFYDSNGEGHTWDELYNFEEDDINDLDF